MRPTVQGAAPFRSKHVPVAPPCKNPRNQQWNLGLQYELARDFVVKTSYVGTKNDRLLATLPINLVNPANIPAPATSIADETSRLSSFVSTFRHESGNASGTFVNYRIDPRFNSVLQLQSSAHSNYNALPIDVTKRMSRGLAFDANYTYGHSIDDISDALGVLVNDVANFQDSRNIRLNRANSQFDIRHRVAASYVYQLPIGQHASRALGRALGGWRVSGTAELRTGFPATILSGARYGIPDPALIGNNGTTNVWANGDVSKLHPIPITQGNFGSPCHRGVQTRAPGCVGDNSLNFPLTQPLLGNFGNSGRNALRLDGLTDFDFALLKDTVITEGKNLQFRWEVYNALNHPNFSGFTNVLTSPSCGTYTSTATNMRQMHMSLKFTF